MRRIAAAKSASFNGANMGKPAPTAITATQMNEYMNTLHNGKVYAVINQVLPEAANVATYEQII